MPAVEEITQEATGFFSWFNADPLPLPVVRPTVLCTVSVFLMEFKTDILTLFSISRCYSAFCSIRLRSVFYGSWQTRKAVWAFRYPYYLFLYTCNDKAVTLAVGNLVQYFLSFTDWECLLTFTLQLPNLCTLQLEPSCINIIWHQTLPLCRK